MFYSFFLSVLISTAFTFTTVEFLTNTPDKWSVSDGAVLLPGLRSEDAHCLEVTVRYNSTHVTVNSPCPAISGELYVWRDIKPAFSSPTLRLSPEQLQSGVELHTGISRQLRFIVTEHTHPGEYSQSDEISVYQHGNWITIEADHMTSDKYLQVDGYSELPGFPMRLLDCPSVLLNSVPGPCSYTQPNEVEYRERRQTTFGLHFSESSYELSLPEDLPTGASILMVSASNGDYTQSLTYTLIKDTFGSTRFEINPSMGNIQLATHLDHEEASIIRIPVLAENEMFEKVVTEVILEIEDVNDKIPQFLRDEYIVSALYSTPRGETIVQVEASDADSGLNGEVMYNLLPGLDSSVFHVDRNTGKIRTENFLHDKEVYSILVQGCDQGTPVLSSNISVTIHVQNNTVPGADPPRFRERVYTATISEMGKSGDRVKRVKADTVYPAASPLQYSIIQGSTPAQNSPRVFQIDPNTGDIRRLGAVDFDGPTPVYSLLVKVRTTQLPEYEDYAQVFVYLEDVNDNIPVFSQSKYTASVLENVPRGTYITTVMATDQDSGSNGDLTYSFGSGETDNFEIDPDKGHIYTATDELDREEHSFYNFFVVATDQGDPYQNSGAKVKVVVLDVNDCPPVFRSDVMEVSIPESAQRGDLVTTLTSIDQDEGRNQAVSYSFLSGNVEEFTLDHGTGLVRVNTTLDYETIQEYSIQVKATDGKWSDIAELRIMLEDVNDHAPIFQEQEYTITAREDMAVSTLLLRLTATDGDAQPNQQIHYQIENRGVPFSVNPNDGWLSISGPLDREQVERYEIVVSATDSGDLRATTQVTISVLDVNDNAPVCLPPFTGQVTENASPGHVVMRVSASDPDVGENAQLSFTLLNHQDRFAMNSTSGELRLVASLDREEARELDLVVKISDNSRDDSKRLFAECNYAIKVLDVNDNSPIFSLQTYSVSFSELTNVGTVVFTLDATDSDEGLNGGLDYTITAGNQPPAFDIHPRTGAISVIGDLDYETKSEYMLTVTVSDRAPPYHASSARLQITIQDGNDNPPAFKQAVYTVDLSEAAALGSVVVTLSATDSEGEQLSYTLLNTFLGTFRLDTPGNIVLMKALDRETVSQYNLSVTVSDAGEPVLSSNATVIVNVLDVNDNPPLFQLPEYRLSISLGTEKDRELLSFVVSDADGPDNGPPFTMAITSGNDRSIFSVTDSSLRLNKPEKLISGTQYELEMGVMDAGSPSLTSTATVLVFVQAENRRPPVGEPVQLSLPLLGGEVPSTLILNYTASDPDPGTVLVYSVEEGDPDFWMYPNGTLVSVERPALGIHKLQVSISDAKHLEKSTISIEVISLESAAAAHPLVVRLEGVTLQTFDRSLFGVVIADTLRTNPADVILLSVEGLTTSRKRAVYQMLDVTLAARSTTGQYLSLQDMKRMISRDLGELQDRTGYVVESVDVDPCLREPCQISATCSPTTTYGNVDGRVVAFRSSQCICPEGYRGHRCDEKIPCQVNPCNSGSCVVEDGSEVCECGENWTGLLCDIPVWHCINSPCLNGGRCRDETIGYTCSCQNGFKGEKCEVKIQPDDLCQDSPCSRNSNCSSGPDKVTCTCHEGWQGQYCTYLSDTEDACAANPCLHGGSCVGSGSQYRCDCALGYRGTNCEENIDECANQPCSNGGSCEDGVDGYICSCPDSYSGTHCQHTAQPCDTSPCLNGGFCYNIDQYNYLCHCARGYVGDTCNTSLVSPGYCEPSPCLQAEMCTAGLLDYTCTCQPTWKDRNCDVHDPSASGCDLNPCFNGGQCVEQENGYIPYTCHCEPGFRGMQCDQNVNECSVDICKNGGTCIDRTNTYECICKSGYSGRHCDIAGDPCLALPCRNNGKCFNVEHSYVCQCTSSYTGRNCETLLTYCPENHCRNGGQCGVRSDGSARCSCKVEFYGEYCQYMYQYCSENPCLNGGTCIEAQDSYRCECPQGHTGPQCQALEIGLLDGGYVALQLPYQLKYSSLSFKIRTNSLNGLLLYTGRYGGGKDYLYVYLSSGQINLEYCVGGEPLSLVLARDVSDRQWHLLTVILHSRQVTLVLDECHDASSRACFVSDTVTGSYYTLDSDTPLYLGGADYPYNFLPDTRYQGCIRDLSLDDVLLDLSQPVSSSRSTVGCIANDCVATCSGQDVCTTTGGVVACQCPFGKTGSSCSTDSPSITLPGSSTLSLSLQQHLDPVALMISIQLRTRIPDCLVYIVGSTGERDYVMLSLTNGQPRLQMSTGGGDTLTPLTMYGRRVDDGIWHTVVFSKVADSVQLELDGAYSAYNLTADSETLFQSHGNIIFSMGGAPSGFNLAVKSGLIGCIRDARLNNRELNLISDSAASTISISGEVISLRCELPPACHQSSCPPTHRCLDTWGDYTCVCPDDFSGPSCNCPAGYTGSSCQYETNECLPDPCVHAVECIDRANDYTCSCKAGYTGKKCDVEINECMGEPCQNGAQCLDLVAGFECRCPARYLGSLCEMDTTPCQDQPCRHGGKCTEYGAGQFGCDCTEAWGGTLCELPKSCDFDPCFHGKCKSGTGPYVTCECYKTYTGPTCEHIDCLLCVNGDCAAQVCTCYEGWTGPTCQDKEEKYTAEAPLQTWIIVLVVVLAALLLLSILIILLCRRRCLNRLKYAEVPKPPRDPGPYYPSQQPYLPHAPQNCTTPDHVYNHRMFQYRPFASPGNMMPMQDLSQSTQTLDNEIKL